MQGRMNGINCCIAKLRDYRASRGRKSDREVILECILELEEMKP